LKSLFIALFLLIACHASGEDWEPISDDLRNVRGINYLATYPSLDGEPEYFGVASSTAMWRYYDTSPNGTWREVDEQLGWLKRSGINTIRVFMSYPAWEYYDQQPTDEEPDGYTRKLKHFVSLCAAHHIRVMPVLWDSHSLANTAIGQSVEPNYVDPLGLKGETLNAPFNTVPQSNVGFWHSNPGPTRVSKWVEQDATLLTTDAYRYIADSQSAFEDHPEALLMWDVMNEPKAALPGHMDFIQSTLAILKRKAGHRALFSWGVSDQFAESIELALNEDLDAIGLHPYGNSMAEIKGRVWDATHVVDPNTKELTPPKPVLCTEIGAPGDAMSYSDAIGFAANVDRPDLGPGEKGVGFMPWVSHIGPENDTDRYPLKHVTGLFYGDGTVRDLMEVNAFIQAALDQGIPQEDLWNIEDGDLIAKPPTASDYVAQGPVSGALDDWLTLATLMNADRETYRSEMTWELFVELGEAFLWATRSATLQYKLHVDPTTLVPSLRPPGTLSLKNENPVMEPVFPWAIAPADQDVLAEFYTLFAYRSVVAPFWVAQVEASYGYTANNEVFDPDVDPEDWPVLGEELYRWAQALKPYFHHQGGPY